MKSSPSSFPASISQPDQGRANSSLPSGDRYQHRYQLGWMDAKAIAPPLERKLNAVQTHIEQLFSNGSLGCKFKALWQILLPTVFIVVSPLVDGLRWGYQSLNCWFASLPIASKKAKRRSLSRPRQLSSETEANTSPEGEQIIVLVDAENFTFHFNNDGLIALQIARSQQRILDIPSKLLAHLRYISFSQILPLPDPNHRNRSQDSAGTHNLFGSFCFCTCYHDTNSHDRVNHERAIAPQDLNSSAKQQRVIRTVLSIDGDILQQISHSSLSHPQVAQIIDAHHWLIQHLLERLQIHTGIYIDYIVLSLNFICFTIYNIKQMPTLLQNPSTAMGHFLYGFGLPYLVALGWELLRRKILPCVSGQVTRWLWKQLLHPTPLIHRLAEIFLRLR